MVLVKLDIDMGKKMSLSLYTTTCTSEVKMDHCLKCKS